jgi:hypothetical protein
VLLHVVDVASNPRDSSRWAAWNTEKAMKNELQDADIARGWVDMHLAANGSEAHDTNFLAYTALDDLRHDDVERFWNIINEIRQLNDSDEILSNLSAGPLEDLLANSGREFIDRCEALAKTDDRFKLMLGMVWKNTIPDDIWKRIEIAASRA